MPLSTIARCLAMLLILTACTRSQPPVLPPPLPPAPGSPTPIATNVGKGQCPFPPTAPSARAEAATTSKGEAGAIGDKVRQCWNIDASAASSRSAVSIRIERVNPDGTVPRDAVSIADDGGNPTMAHAAVRAILNPVCQPWPIPRGGWPKEPFILVFDTKDFF